LDKLPDTLKSLHNDHEIVVVTYNGVSDHQQIVEKICPQAIHVMYKEDRGCNALWAEAISLAKTRWVSLLADDDLRPPGFAAEVEKIIDQCESHGAGFATWNGRAYYWSDHTLGHPINTCYGRAGIYASAPLAAHIMTAGKYPWSQVAFLYDRETVLDVLAWCEEHLKDCGTRPTMMVGNDVALTLGHIQRFPRMVQSAKCLTWYGHHDGSETLQYAAGKNDLMGQYDKARTKLQNIVFPRRKT
jgi:glycosyltransferase involved in cell wall biosynthesis